MALCISFSFVACLICLQLNLSDNMLCGIDHFGDGTYTAEGIAALCEGLEGSAVTSLECAAAPKLYPDCMQCQDPLTCISPAPASGSLSGNGLNDAAKQAIRDAVAGRDVHLKM